jgi:RNA polymerase-binding transcription factor
VDPVRARQLLESERQRTQRRLDELLDRGQDDRSAANEPGDMFDSAQPLIQQGADDSVIAELRLHLDAINRAESRLDHGTYGFSLRSGLPIPDERLESDPTAELTVDEAAEGPMSL